MENPPLRCPACFAELPKSREREVACPSCGAVLTVARSLLEPTLYRLGTAWALVALQEHMEWSALVDAWRDKRERWARGLRETGDPAVVARHLLDLEGSTRWEAVARRWVDEREAWAAPLKAARIEEWQLVVALRRFELGLRWDAVIPPWKTFRDGWDAELGIIDQRSRAPE